MLLNQGAEFGFFGDQGIDARRWAVIDPNWNASPIFDSFGPLPSRSQVLLIRTGPEFVSVLAKDPTKVVGGLRLLRRAYPHLPFVLSVEGGASLNLMADLMIVLGPVRWVTTRDLDPTEMNRALTAVHPEHLFHWLSCLCIPRSVSSVGALRLLADYIGQGNRTGLEEIPHSIRKPLRRMALPNPHRWVMLRRTLVTILDLQRDPRISHARAAYSRGYSDPSQFRRHCRQLLGECPSSLREALGWEPIISLYLGLGRSDD